MDHDLEDSPGTGGPVPFLSFRQRVVVVPKLQRCTRNEIVTPRMPRNRHHQEILCMKPIFAIVRGSQN